MKVFQNTNNGMKMLNHNNVHYEIDKIVEKLEINDYKFTLRVRASIKSRNRNIKISINNETIFSGDIEEGNYEYTKEMHIPPGQSVCFEIATNTHQHGDKIIVETLLINGVDIEKTNLWIMDLRRFKHTDGRIEEKVNGLYHNGQWSITLPTPIFPWIVEKKRQLSVGVKYKTHDLGYDEKIDDMHYKILDRVYRN